MTLVRFDRFPEILSLRTEYFKKKKMTEKIDSGVVVLYKHNLRNVIRHLFQ